MGNTVSPAKLHLKPFPELRLAYGVGCTVSSEIKQVTLQGSYNKLCQATHILWTSPHHLCYKRTHQTVIKPTVITQLFNISSKKNRLPGPMGRSRMGTM